MNTNPATNENLAWTAASWRAHVAPFHPAHAAASYALHREEMGRLAPSAKVITALTMTGKRYSKFDREPLDYESALLRINVACARRAMGPVLVPAPPALEPTPAPAEAAAQPAL